MACDTACENGRSGETGLRGKVGRPKGKDGSRYHLNTRTENTSSRVSESCQSNPFAQGKRIPKGGTGHRASDHHAEVARILDRLPGRSRLQWVWLSTGSAARGSCFGNLTMKDLAAFQPGPAFPRRECQSSSAKAAEDTILRPPLRCERRMVEAAGVEPASRANPPAATTCLVRKDFSAVR